MVGLGYVGLPTALALHASGASVVGVDVDGARLRAIRRLEVDLLPQQRAELSAALRDPAFRLTAGTGVLAEADAVIICVPTPVDRHRMPDLRALRAACAAAVARAAPGQLLVLTSTSYVGTTRDLLIVPLAERGLDAERDVFVASSPERIDPGNPRHTQDTTPRVVGGAGPLSTERAAALLARTACAVHRAGSPEAAEMAKLWENSFRAVNIALANELADACAALGLEPRQVIEAAATKPYGFMPFYPGPGAGGHCIPCDPHYLLWQLPSHLADAPLTAAAMAALAARPRQVVRRALALLAERGTPFDRARVLLFGVTYKAGVADLRQSPALEIITALAERGADVGYTDPLVPSLTCGTRTLHHIADPAAMSWDLVVVHTLHPGADAAWLRDGVTVLDPSHRLTASRPAARLATKKTATGKAATGKAAVEKAASHA